ncbi:extracellular solute-binding protein [Planomicrobium chinense]|uniref:ABC transporter substrate-binding protein n=1 Tax=Planococcus TaxID=1372 RepID=UPI00069FD502|nr:MULTISPECIES: extracellular solute-binding protein [Planococcus]KOF10635.1 ABC transporter substrate-binding protein [Planococcus glaciei]MBZ5201539.1 extracellular solute-binding protein [Planococcus chinensis]SDH53457.1 lactose-binding protein [Planococcus glaciei]
MKKFYLMLVLLVGLAVLAACSSGDEEASGGSSAEGAGSADTITAWAWDPAFNIAALEKAKEAYNGDGDFEVKIIENAQDDIIQKLNTGLSSGTTKGMPNIVLIEDYRAQSFLQAYPDAFHPLTDVINPEDFADYKIATTSHNGEQYGLPFDSGVAGLYVRTDYLEQAGYTAEDLTNITWDEYIEIGKKVKEATGKNMLTLDPNDLGQIRMMIQTNGSWYVKEDGSTPNLAGNETLAKAFETYKKMMDADIGKIVSDWSQFVGAFNSGDVASVPTGNWITPSIKQEAEQSGKWAVVPMPRLDMEGAVNASNLGGSSWYILNVDGKEEAADFMLNTFGSNADLYQTLVKDIGALGTYSAAAEGDAYAVEDEFFGGQQIITDFSKWTDEIPGVNYGLHTYAIEDILVTGMQDYLKGTELTKVLENVQGQAEAQLK